MKILFKKRIELIEFIIENPTDDQVYCFVKFNK